jgi:hypothetical protein
VDIDFHNDWDYQEEQALRVSAELHDYVIDVLVVSVSVDNRGGFNGKAVYFFDPDFVVEKEISCEFPDEEDDTAVKLVGRQEKSLNVPEDVALVKNAYSSDSILTNRES